MGFYLNPTSRSFEGDFNSQVYIDKSLIIDVLNEKLDKNNDKYICVSRPRRFGKTQIGNMLAAYYSKGASSDFIFSKLGISKTQSYKKHLNKYNVIKIDLNGFYRNTDDKNTVITDLKETVINEIKEEYNTIDFSLCKNFNSYILKVYAKTNIPFVIIIDEYDVLIREKVNEELFNQYLDLLNGLFKDSVLSEAISLAYITGILPIVVDKVQSKLNNFTQSTMLEPNGLEQFFGFLPDDVSKLCKKYNLNFTECKKWYDGYRLNNLEIYNPNAIVKTISTKKYMSHWSATGSYESISDYINLNFDGVRDEVIKMISGGRADVNSLSFQNRLDKINNRDDIFTYLIHIGYLAYDEENKTCYIPNFEVSLEWNSAIRNNNDYSVTNKIIASSKALVESTLNLDSKAVSLSLDASHINVTSNRSYNNEDALASAVYLSYIWALNDWLCFKEIPSGKGIADVIYVPLHNNKPALIIELKHNKSSGIALEQIKNKKYFTALENYHGELYFIGINYNENTKTHDSVIQKYSKE